LIPSLSSYIPDSQVPCFFHQIVILFLGKGLGPTGAGKVDFPLIKVIRKVRKTQHQGYSLKYIRAGGGGAGEKYKNNLQNLVNPVFTPPFRFPERLH
jgi:hypothetical protein